jgi:hypothetical protein
MGALARHDSGDLHELNPKETSATKSWPYSPSRLSVLCLLAASAPGAPPLAELRDNAQIRCCRVPPLSTQLGGPDVVSLAEASPRH